MLHRHLLACAPWVKLAERSHPRHSSTPASTALLRVATLRADAAAVSTVQLLVLLAGQLAVPNPLGSRRDPERP